MVTGDDPPPIQQQKKHEWSFHTGYLDLKPIKIFLLDAYESQDSMQVLADDLEIAGIEVALNTRTSRASMTYHLCNSLHATRQMVQFLDFIQKTRFAVRADDVAEVRGWYLEQLGGKR